MTPSSLPKAHDERVRLLLSRRRQELEMRAQEERLRVAEDGPIREDLERHLVLLDRQLGGWHERRLDLMQMVAPHPEWAGRVRLPRAAELPAAVLAVHLHGITPVHRLVGLTGSLP
ncbi:hypothetical protein [Deinococcus aerius]|nr:hypothetical protein [Deinococcus aerius]